MLSKQFIKSLKDKAHSLKPVILVGNKGLTESVYNEIAIALNAHELIKIKLAGVERDERKAMISEMVNKTKSHLINTIGAIAVIYKENTDKK